MTKKNMKDDLKRCTKCVMAETHEAIVFDENGVCTACRNVERKTQINWQKKEEEFKELVESYRGKYVYDCLVPFSGGKDSTFTLWALVKNYGLKPLVVSFDHGFFRPNVLANRDRVLKQLGVDYLSFRPSWHVVKKLMLEALSAKGDFCWHCHSGVFCYPMQVAVEKRVPLIIWGEPAAEYTNYYSYDKPEEVDEERYNRIASLGITARDMVHMVEGVTLRDLAPFMYPPLEKIKELGGRSICLGSYIPWDTRRQSEIISRQLGWKGDKVEGMMPGYEYEKIECMMQGMRDYIIYLKTGFSRVTHITSIDIRNGRFTRDEALKLIKKYEGKKPASLKIFLKMLEITEDEFNEIVLRHVRSPHQPDLAKIKRGKPLPDMAFWQID